jgi:DNA-binding transcriptional LysR family regulator
MLNQNQLSRIDLNLLVLFDVVLAERHVGRAAERLILTPSAVSHSLGRLRVLLNDPLFLRKPKGVEPTARALELAAPIAEILQRVGNVISTAAPFDPATTRRRFAIGAPDAVLAVFLLPLLDVLSRTAPGIDISLHHMMPEQRSRQTDQVWRSSLDDVESRTVDLAVLPIGKVPPRFIARKIYEEEFVVAMRKGHLFSRKPTLERFCEMRHLLVSLSGNAHGMVDEMLAVKGLSRRVAVTVPNFMMALAQVAKSDLIAALPKHLLSSYAGQFGLVTAKLPLPRSADPISAIATKAAMMDAGVAWLFGKLGSLPLTPARLR